MLWVLRIFMEDLNSTDFETTNGDFPLMMTASIIISNPTDVLQVSASR